MKPYDIDIERIDGASLAGHFIEVQGALSVRATSEPREGVYESSMHMSLDQAFVLHKYLTAILDRAKQSGWKPTLV